MKYFYLSWSEGECESGVACGPKGALGHEIEKSVRGREETPWEWDLDESSNMFDYLANTLAWPLVSERLKSVIVENLEGGESVRWIRSCVRYGNDRVLYFIPEFPVVIDVIDRKKSVMAGDQVVRPHISLEKAKGLNLFPRCNDRFTISVSLFVSDRLRKAIVKAGLSGMTFTSVRAS